MDRRFISIQVDLLPGTSGGAKVYEIWRCNTGRLESPNSYFTVFASTDIIYTWEWDLGATLTVAIDDPSTGDNPDYSTEGL